MFPQSSTMSTRPVYLDNLFRHNASPSTPSLHSSTSSISCSSTASSYDLRSAYNNTRPLTPALEENFDDRFSLRSKKSSLRQPRKFRFGRIFTRRRSPIMETIMPTAIELEEAPLPPSTAAAIAPTVTPSTTLSSRPSLPKLQTNFPPPRRASTYAKKPLPAVPRPRQAQELSCRQCYYTNARNCHGWVLGGSNGDACETCLQAGFFGEK